MSNIVKGLNLLIRTCELFRDYEEKKLTREQLEERVDILMKDVTDSYNESEKRDDPEIKKDFEELTEQYTKFKSWIKTTNEL